MVADNIAEKTKLAITQQQHCYKLFSELCIKCHMYGSYEHVQLKQFIARWIFRSLRTEESKNKIDHENRSYYKLQNADIPDFFDAITYDKQIMTAVEKIYRRICECAYAISDSSVYVGVIYNVIIFPDENLEPKKEDTSADKKEPIKTDEKEEKSDKKEQKVNKKNEKHEKNVERPAILLIPIFTVKLSNKRNLYIGRAANDIGYEKYTKLQSNYETWYIDTNARVYKTWTSYVTTNLLPKCTMVLPKDGVYKPDPNNLVTKNDSTVWVEIMDSPACTTAAKVCRGIDYAFIVAGMTGFGLSVTSLFTNIAPVVIVSGLVVTGASGVWTIGRCIVQLIDRNNHMESINLFNSEEAFPYWLGLAGSLAGLRHRRILVSKAVGNRAISSGPIKCFVVASSTLILNGVGIACMSYSMIEKYWKDKTVSVMDALNLATHVMFFAATVC